MINSLIFHIAFISIFSAGIELGISISQPINVYPSFAGLLGEVICVL